MMMDSKALIAELLEVYGNDENLNTSFDRLISSESLSDKIKSLEACLPDSIDPVRVVEQECV